MQTAPNDSIGGGGGRSESSRPASLLLTADQAAHLLGVSTRTLWRLHSAGQLPRSVKIGGSTRWRREEIERWIAEGCPAPTSPEQ
jgi:excisionase family DNA binding protein